MTLFRNLKQLISRNSNSYSLCMVVAEQEGSEIWLEGKKTSYRTPRLVAIPKNKEVCLEVKQRGFETHKVFVRSAHDLSYHYCHLQRTPLRLVRNDYSPAMMSSFADSI